MVDKVKPLKVESASGGVETDLYPTETDSTEDYLAAKGMAFENLDATRIYSESGVIKTQDSQVTDPASLYNMIAMSPVHLTKVGNLTVGTYLRIGEVITSTTGIVIPGNYKIIKISASASATPGSTTRLHIQRRTAVSTFSDLTGAFVDIPNTTYKATNSGLSINLSTNEEIVAYNKSGSTLSSVIMTIYMIPRD